MAYGLTWQLLLHVPPYRVFAALVRATGEGGRLHDVEDYGTALTFTTTRWPSDGACDLRARVRPHGGGTLLQIGPVDQRIGRDTTLEAESIGSLIHQLRAYFTAGTDPAASPALPAQSDRRSSRAKQGGLHYA